MSIKTKERRYNVTLYIDGEVTRQVLATSEDEALRKVRKALFTDDAITIPKSNAVQAFGWKRCREIACVDPHDWTPEENAAFEAEMEERRAARQARLEQAEAGA